MKLSKAIRVGAMIRPQAFGELERTEAVEEKVGWFRRRVHRVKKSCAMGAAIEAEGCGFKPSTSGGIPFRGEPVPVGQGRTLDSPPEWNILNYYHDCPQCEFEPESTLIRVITHLNDEHRWTREQIALLVERFEQKVEVAERKERESQPEFQETQATMRRQKEQQEQLDQMRAEELKRQQAREAQWPEFDVAMRKL